MTTTNARKLFGTDGIRAVAGESPLDATTIFAVGLALGHSLQEPRSPRWFWAATRASPAPGSRPLWPPACAKPGARVESAGVVPTPAVAFLARTHGFQAGVVISASHNPWRDNGIKLFGGDGFKLADAVENWPWKMRSFITPPASTRRPIPTACPRSRTTPPWQADYIQFLLDCVPGLSLAGLRIVADCANGAAAAVAPELFRRLGGEVTLLHIAPDGRNINDGCGALHPAYVAAEVSARGADLGLTFDGDADRCMLAGAHEQRHQRRRHSADGRARPEGARTADRRPGRGHHHVATWAWKRR